MANSANKELVIIGAGGHARVVADTVIAMGISLKGIIDIEYHGQKEEIMGCPVLGGLEFIEQLEPAEAALAIAVGDNTQRSHYYTLFKQKGFSFPPLIHPTAVVSKFSYISDGTFINAGAIINSGAKIGQNCIINSGSIIEHEVSLGMHCHICPGVKIGGRVVVGDNSFIGIGTSIIDYIKVGSNVIVGAGSVIIKNIEPSCSYAGVPGKKIK